MATEESKFELISKHDRFELRRYRPFVVADRLWKATWVLLQKKLG